MQLHQPFASSIRTAMSALIFVTSVYAAPQEPTLSERRMLLREQRLLEEAKVIAERSKQKSLRDQRLLEEAKAIVEREKQKTIRLQLQQDQARRENESNSSDSIVESPPAPDADLKKSPASIPPRKSPALADSSSNPSIIPAVLISTEPAKSIPAANHYPPAKSPEIKVGEKCIQGSLWGILALGLTTLGVCALDSVVSFGAGCAATFAWAEAQLITTAIGGCVVGELNTPASAANLGIPRPSVQPSR